MALKVFTNIRYLVNVRSMSSLLKGEDLAGLPVIENAFLIIEDGIIAAFGKMEDFKKKPGSAYRIATEVEGAILPCWCDSHTHLVFAGSREGEFIDKIKGLSYAEIAEKGGGILNSAKRLNDTSEDDLFNQSWARLQKAAKLGTGAIEIKSGYGLSVEGELKMLRVIKKLKQKSSLLIKSTFLGAHTYPAIYKNNHRGYIDLLVNEMLPVIAKEKLADYIDVFCERGFFSPEETEVICKAGMQYGLKPKLHVNQLNSIGGIETGIKLNALSLDHLETLTEKDIQLLGNSYTMAGSAPGDTFKQDWSGVCTLLPTAAFFLGMPMQPARALINAGAAIALASDYNPGSSPSGNMNFVVSLSCIQMKMLPEEAINAATINGAFAMGVQNEAGSITVGKKANLIFTGSIPSLAYLPYSFGTNLIERVMINGEFMSPCHTKIL